jgi:hypothetical protein
MGMIGYIELKKILQNVIVTKPIQITMNNTGGNESC